MFKGFSVVVLTLAVGLVSIGGSAAAAGPTLVQLAAPPSGLVNVHSASCAASGFNADGTIAGVCKYTYGSSGGSGRGGGYRQSPTASFPATWTAFGQVVGLGANCGCSPNYQGTRSVVVINGAPFYYVATAANGNELVNSNAAGFLVLQSLPAIPAAPLVTAVQVGTTLQISWTPDASVANAISSSMVTVARADGTGTNLTTAVASAVTMVTLGPVTAATAYAVSVISNDVAGASNPGVFSITTTAVTQVPDAPVITYIWWSGSTYGLAASSWTAPNAYNSPIDEYEVSVTWQDGDVQTPDKDIVVGGTTLSAYIGADNTSTWSVQVRAHNAAGWGAWSMPRQLGGL